MSIQNHSKPKLLVVDDEPDNLDLLYRTLYRDYHVLTAENAPAALELLAKEGDVAVIISDQRMPQMSGTEFLSVTATQYPDTIRIILTAYTDVDDLVDAINAGKVFKYVTKPWDADELKALVAQALDTHNVLKARTRELCRTLRQESLLNAVTNTIRARTTEAQILQTIVDTLGQMFEASYCILRPYQQGQFTDEWFVYQKREVPTAKLNGRAIASTTERSGQIADASILAKTVWETHDIEVIQDTDTDDRLQGNTPETWQRARAFQSCDIRSSLVVPLMFRLELMAVLALHQCGEPRVWQDDEVQLVFMVADQAVLSLSQARAYEQVQALAKREALVNTITTAIRSSLNPKEIFAAIAQQLGQALQADGCALSLWTQEDEYVQCVGLYDAALQAVEASEGERMEENETGAQDKGQSSKSASGGQQMQPGSSELPRSVVPIAGNPVLQQLLMTQQPVVVNDLAEQPELNVLDLPLRSAARALLVVPLISDGQIIGSITLRQTHAPRRWQQSEIDLAQAVAAQGAIAVQQSRLYQKTRQQAERLLELNRIKTEFFQNISHEFRTPLTLMMGPLESAVEHQRDLSLEQAQMALRNTRRLLRLVNQLLDLQRLDAGRVQPTFRPCDLVAFVMQTVETFRPYCQKKGIGLSTDLRACPALYLDLEKFDKVLYNLLSNAMKFTAPGGNITVSVEQAGDYCLLQVRDTGIGIRTDQIPHLFERFRQAEGSANRSYEGSGLGLALVKELVELHGGSITVDSVYGEGSTFAVWLPTGNAHLPPDQIIEVPTGVQPARASVELADVEMELQDAHSPEEEIARQLQAVPESESEGSRPKILVVDDNPDLRYYVSGILQANGYRVILARNGAEGFDRAKSERPDLILTDLMMPLVSGLDTIQMIRENETIAGTPIILLTAKVNEDTRIEGVERGADAYLAKPFNDRELLAEVRNLLALKDNERRVAQLNHYLTESVLKRFLPPSMVQKAAAGELALDLRPEPRLITVLFSDIVGFTQLANTLRSRRVAEVLNQYLAEMTQAVFDHGGTVDKFVGDAIMAIFGAPEDMTPNEQVKRAIATAKQMLQALDGLNAEWEAQGLPRVQFRCGINQGTAVVGMFGGTERSDYTAIGPSVNIASRLQEAADPGRILVSAAVADYMNDDEIVKFRPLQFKGIDETVLTFMVKG